MRRVKKTDTGATHYSYSQETSPENQITRPNIHTYSLPKSHQYIEQGGSGNSIGSVETQEICVNRVNKECAESITFDVVRLEKSDECIKLYGHDILCVVKDFWMNTTFLPGMSVTVSKCLCCSNNYPLFPDISRRPSQQGMLSPDTSSAFLGYVGIHGLNDAVTPNHPDVDSNQNTFTCQKMDGTSASEDKLTSAKNNAIVCSLASSDSDSSDAKPKGTMNLQVNPPYSGYCNPENLQANPPYSGYCNPKNLQVNPPCSGYCNPENLQANPPYSGYCNPENLQVNPPYSGYCSPENLQLNPPCSGYCNPETDNSYSVRNYSLKAQDLDQVRTYEQHKRDITIDLPELYSETSVPYGNKRLRTNQMKINEHSNRVEIPSNRRHNIQDDWISLETTSEENTSKSHRSGHLMPILSQVRSESTPNRNVSKPCASGTLTSVLSQYELDSTENMKIAKPCASVELMTVLSHGVSDSTENMKIAKLCASVELMTVLSHGVSDSTENPNLSKPEPSRDNISVSRQISPRGNVQVSIPNTDPRPGAELTTQVVSGEISELKGIVARNSEPVSMDNEREHDISINNHFCQLDQPYDATKTNEADKQAVHEDLKQLADEHNEFIHLSDDLSEVSLFSMFSDPFEEDHSVISGPPSWALHRTQSVGFSNTGVKSPLKIQKQLSSDLVPVQLQPFKKTIKSSKLIATASSSQKIQRNAHFEHKIPRSQDSSSNGLCAYPRMCDIQQKHGYYRRDEPEKLVEINKDMNIILINGSVLSVTAVCASINCIYLPILDQFMMDISFDWKHQSLAIGVIMHAVIEKSLESGDFSLKYIMNNINTEIKNQIKLIYTCNSTERRIKNECVSFIQPLMALKTRNIRVCAIEQPRLSTLLCLKGTIDAMTKKDGKFIPFEIKTGKSIDISHRAQLLLYLLIINETELAVDPCGTLYYAQKSDFHTINLKHDEACGLLAHKNRIASLEFINRHDILSEDNLFGSCKVFMTKNESVLNSRDYNQTGSILNSRDCNPTESILHSRDYNQTGSILHSRDYNHTESILHSRDYNQTGSILHSRDYNQTGSILHSRDYNQTGSILHPRDYNQTFQPICSCEPSSTCKLIFSLQNLEGYKGEFLRGLWEGVQKEEIAASNKPRFECTLVAYENLKLVLSCSDLTCFEICDYVEIYTSNHAYLTYGKVEKMAFPNIQVSVPCNNMLRGIGKVFITESTNKLFFKMMRFSIVKFGISSDLIYESAQNESESEYVTDSSLNLCNAAFDSHQDSFIDLNIIERRKWKCPQAHGELYIENLDLTANIPEIRSDTVSGIHKGHLETCEKFEKGIESHLNNEPSKEAISVLKLKSNDSCGFSVTNEHTGSINVLDSENDGKSVLQLQSNDSCGFSVTNEHTGSINDLDSKIKGNHIVHGSLSKSTEVMSTSPGKISRRSPIGEPKYYGRISDSQLDDSKLIKIPETFIQEFMQLNEDQRRALYLSLNCDKFNIIHGFPGSGKSTLIALLIRILAYYGRKVLLICYTNLAIDNILRKTSVKSYRALKDSIDEDSVSKLKEKFDNLDLVAGTCFSFSDIVYLNRKFDFCIIDEASQIHFPLALVPIGMSRKFILVGDHLQLRPLSKASEELRYSLFQHLLHAKNFCKLRKQYRMGDEIMSLANKLFYKNEMLGTGSSSKIIFIDSQKYPSYEEILQKFELSETTTILCYFNKQVSSIKSIVHNKCAVETIDRFQGSENDQIILIFDPIIECEIISSRERLNVGLTRARKKLILVGDFFKMLKIPLLNSLLSILPPRLI